MVSLCEDCMYRTIRCKGNQDCEKTKCEFFREHPSILVDKLAHIIYNLTEENLHLSESYEEYKEKVDKIKEYIK